MSMINAHHFTGEAYVTSREVDGNLVLEWKGRPCGTICVYRDVRTNATFAGAFDTCHYEPLNQVIVPCDVDMKTTGGYDIPVEGMAGLRALQKPGDFDLKYTRPSNNKDVRQVCMETNETEFVAVRRVSRSAFKRCVGVVDLKTVQECAGASLPDDATLETQNKGRTGRSHLIRIKWLLQELVAYPIEKKERHQDRLCVWARTTAQANLHAPSDLNQTKEKHPLLVLNHPINHTLRKTANAGSQGTVRLEDGKQILSKLYEKQEDGVMPVILDPRMNILGLRGEVLLNMSDIQTGFAMTLNARNWTNSSLSLTIRYERVHQDGPPASACAWESKDQPNTIASVALVLAEIKQLSWCPPVRTRLPCAKGGGHPNAKISDAQGNDNQLCTKTVLQSKVKHPYYPHPVKNTHTDFVCAWEKGTVIDGCNYGQFSINDDNWLLKGVWRGDKMPVDVRLHADTSPGNLLGGIVQSIVKPTRKPGEIVKTHPCEALIPANGSDALSLEVEHGIKRPTIIVSYEHANSIYTDEVAEEGKSAGLGGRGCVRGCGGRGGGDCVWV